MQSIRVLGDGTRERNQLLRLAYRFAAASEDPKIDVKTALKLIGNLNSEGYERIHQAIEELNPDPSTEADIFEHIIGTNQLLLTCLAVAARCGKLLEFLGGDEDVMAMVAEALPAAAAYWRIEDKLRQAGIDPLQIDWETIKQGSRRTMDTARVDDEEHE